MPKVHAITLKTRYARYFTKSGLYGRIWFKMVFFESMPIMACAAIIITITRIAIIFFSCNLLQVLKTSMTQIYVDIEYLKYLYLFTENYL